MKKLLGISLLALLASINIYGEGIEKGQGNGISIGKTSNSENVTNIAVGENSDSKGENSIAIGSESKTKKGNSVALGGNAQAIDGSTIAIGLDSNSQGYDSIAIGSNSKTEKGSSVALGRYAQTMKENAIAIGSGSKAENAQSVSIGTSSVAGGHSSSAYGFHSKSSGISSVAIGDSSNSIGSNTIAIGKEAESKGDSGISIGLKAKSSTSNTIALGAYASVEGVGTSSSIAIGNGAYIGELPNKESNDIGAPGYKKDLFPEDYQKYQQKGRKYSNSIALGLHAKSYGFQNIAIGGTAETYDTNTISIGHGSVGKGHFSVALGKQAQTQKDYALASGSYAIAEGEGSTALGHNAYSYIDSSVALGEDSLSNRNKNILGYDPSGNIKSLDDVLGDNKEEYIEITKRIETLEKEIVTSRKDYKKIIDDIDNSTLTGEERKKFNQEQAQKMGNKLNEIYVKKEEIKELDIKKNKMIGSWVSSRGAVSIGNNTLGIKRQITNVAAGTVDSDAVNVAQLKKITLKVSSDNGENSINLSSGNLSIKGENGITTRIDSEGNLRIGNSKNEMDKSTISGIANAMAMANLINRSEGDLISVGLGMYKGETSIALGLLGSLGKNEKVSYKLSSSISSHGDIGFGLGVSYLFNNKKKDVKDEEIQDLKTKIDQLTKIVNELKK